MHSVFINHEGQSNKNKNTYVWKRKKIKNKLTDLSVLGVSDDSNP